MPSSFGSMLAEAAKQSRLAREEDEKRQLAMLQAGFVPKPQPEAPPQRGGMLSNVLPSLKRTYGYQPQFQASDYQMGEHHPAKIAEAQRVHDARNDPWLRKQWDADRALTAAQGASQELINQRLAIQKAYWDELAQQEVAMGKVSLRGAELSNQATEQEMDINDELRPLRSMLLKLEGDVLRNELSSNELMQPLRKKLAELQIDIAEFDMLKNGSGIITAADGSMYRSTLDPETGTYSLNKLFGPDPKKAEDSFYRRLGLLYNLASLTSDEDDRAAIATKIEEEMKLLSLANLMGGSKSPDTLVVGKSGEVVTEEGDTPPSEAVQGEWERLDLPETTWQGMTDEEKAWATRKMEAKKVLKGQWITQKEYDLWAEGKPEPKGSGRKGTDTKYRKAKNKWNEIDKIITEKMGS